MVSASIYERIARPDIVGFILIYELYTHSIPLDSSHRNASLVLSVGLLAARRKVGAWPGPLLASWVALYEPPVATSRLGQHPLDSSHSNRIIPHSSRKERGSNGAPAKPSLKSRDSPPNPPHRFPNRTGSPARCSPPAVARLAPRTRRAQ